MLELFGQDGELEYAYGKMEGRPVNPNADIDFVVSSKQYFKLT